MNTRGFTLIELLVVIAIIGLLSSIVLASLSTARDKGRDAAIQSDLNSIRIGAELVRDNAKACYPGPSGLCAAAQTVATLTGGCNPSGGNQNLLCSHDPIYRALVGATTASGGAFFAFQNSQSATAYAVAVRLVTDKALAWCIDSSGQSKRMGTPDGTALTGGNAGTIADLMTNGACE
ncbi:MAG: type II secretion system protein [bacterium]|nr:type II secretion system protein [bacterium]